MQNENENVVELIGEDGVAIRFEHLMTLEHGDESYVLLTPLEPETEDEEDSVAIMRIGTDEKGADCYIVEEDEAIMEEIFGRFMEILEAEEDEEL